MGLSIFALILGCLLTCRGLELTLDRDTSGLDSTRSICGVLVCEEFANGSLSSKSDSDRTHPEVVLDTITSLSVVKISSSSLSNTGDRDEILLGSITAQSSSFTRVSNGRKIDGILQSNRAVLRIELAKEADCENEFSCQLQGKDSQGRDVVSTTRLMQQSSKQKAHPGHHGSLTPAVTIQLMAAFQQLAQVINGLENRREDKISALENRLEDKVTALENRLEEKYLALKNTLEDKVSALANTLEDKLFIFQNNLFSIQTSLGHLENQEIKVEAKLATLENTIGQIQKKCSASSSGSTSKSDILQSRFDLLESNIAAKINDMCQSKSMQINLKPSSDLDFSLREAKEDIVKRLERLSKEQKETLQNVSGRFENSVRNATAQLTSLLENIKESDECDQTAVLTERNETKDILEKLVSGEVSVRCMSNATTGPQKIYRQPLRCDKDMGKTLNQSYPEYLTMTQFSLGQDILCDTKTDGGGWTVILRRIKGDLYFNRDWESYKNGFGKPGPDEDFWLGNEAVFKLTHFRSYELRIELTSEGKKYAHVYSTFKLESEANKYTLRLGTGTGSLDDGSHGLSYSNNAPFSTFDRDNDSFSGSCAIKYKCGWWHKTCNNSKLTAPLIGGQVFRAFHTGKTWLNATRLEMKMRPLKSG